MHWDHEPERAQRRAGVPPAQRARQRERFRSVVVADGGRRDACPTLWFVESCATAKLSFGANKPTPASKFELADGCPNTGLTAQNLDSPRSKMRDGRSKLAEENWNIEHPTRAQGARSREPK